MQVIKTALICLDLTEMDDILIQYADFLSDYIKDIDRVIFAHNIKFDYPDSAQAIINELDKPLKDLIREVLEEKINPVFSYESNTVSYDIVIEESESTPRALAEIAKSNKVDLTITGKKISYKGSGLVSEKLLQIVDFKSSLLMVPETAYHQIKNIVTPTDFSRFSKAAIERGIYLQKQTQAKHSCLHVLNIPAHFFPYIPVNDMKSKMRSDADKVWKKLIKGIDDSPECRIIFGEGESTADAIYSYALRHNKDLIVISAKGKGAFTSFTIGSVANRLIQKDLFIPLMIMTK